jgi:hypothetical protein
MLPHAQPFISSEQSNTSCYRPTGPRSQIDKLNVGLVPKADIWRADLVARRLKSISSRWEILGNSGSRLN